MNASWVTWCVCKSRKRSPQWTIKLPWTDDWKNVCLLVSARLPSLSRFCRNECPCQWKAKYEEVNAENEELRLMLRLLLSESADDVLQSELICRKRSGSIQQSSMTTIDTPSPPQSVVNMDMRGGNINNIGRDVHNHVHNHSVTISIRFVWLNTVIYKCDADRNMIQWRQHDSVSQRGSKLAVFTDDIRSILVIFWIDGRVRRGSTVFVTLHFTRLSHGFKLVSNLHDWVPGVWNSTHIISHAPLLTCQGAWYYYLTWS